MNESEWKKDFLEFLDVPAQPPPSEVGAALRAKVHYDMHPAVFAVFTKLALCVLFAGLSTLLVCPQFGLGFSNGAGLMYIFMRFGIYACHAACGAFFLGSGVFGAALLLKPEELMVLRQSQFLLLSASSALSLGIFVCLGAPAISLIGLTWLLGAVCGGLFSIRAGILLRSTVA